MIIRQFFLICLFFYPCKILESTVVVTFNLWNYSNPCNCLYDGRCCRYNYLSGLCGFSECNVRTKICLDDINSINSISNYSSCSLGSKLIDPILNQSSFSYSNFNTSGLHIFNFEWTLNGPPKFFIKIYTEDTTLYSGRDLNIDQIIDQYIISFNNDSSIHPSSDKSNWIDYPLTNGQYKRNGTQKNSSISFSVHMRCSNNYYGENCSVLCVPQNDCSGHYKCDQLTGAKICNFGFYDESTNCVKRNESLVTCNKTCLNNGYCYEANVTLLNTILPFCCCPEGYTGEFCETALSCDLQICNNGLCFINQTTNLPYCICQIGFTGQNCEKKCPENFYGKNCENYCVANQTCEIHTQCDINGVLSCTPGWGPFPFCNQKLISQQLDPECPSGYCLNGGSCSSGKCCCASGFTGVNCELKIDICSYNQCLNGAQCISNGNSFTCLCANGYVGTFCQTLIDPCLNASICSLNGNCISYRNSSLYECKCFEGYNGTNCEIKIDYCASRPCFNNATCLSFSASYYCSCPLGFEGVQCEIQTNLCKNDPCVHGNCSDFPGGYLCRCESGWSNPKTCNDDIDECSQILNICNNGICLNTLGNFVCQCDVGYSGQYCEIKIDSCASDPCIYSSSCVNTNDQYKCICLPGYTGVRCETELNECESSPCQSGTCQNRINGFLCLNCTQGYEGVRCEKQIDLCTSNKPCITNQTESCLPYLNDYQCVCKAGYAGKNCEINIDECDSNPCKNNGTCVDDVNGFICVCSLGYIGFDCSLNTDPCLEQNCSLRGKCYSTFARNTTSFFCVCDAGYEGRVCERQIDYCSTNICLNNATCTSLFNDFNCSCVPGYEGRFCESNINECSSNPCLNGGVCLDDVNNYRCLCTSLYVGINCDIQIDACQSNPCLNNGSCLKFLNDSTQFTCNCDPRYTGTYCQIQIDPCDSNPCISQQGICQTIQNQNTNLAYKCNCVSGYTGLNCETKIDYCESNPCLNNSTCTSLQSIYNCNCSNSYYGKNCENFFYCSQSPCSTEGSIGCIDLLDNYTCVCKQGYSGFHCEINIDDCASSPCHNNSTCTDLVNDFFCNCPKNYFGKSCELKINFCIPDPCYGNSTCLNLEDRYSCVCPTNYTGPTCAQQRDACSIVPCLNGGTCINQATFYECKCLPGYSGNNCEIDINECSSNPCENNSTCVNLINDFYCICQPGYTNKTCSIMIDYCAQGNVCLNNATCQTVLNGFKCTCLNGFSGSRCDALDNVCANVTCLNNGLCNVDVNGKPNCQCPVGFNGTFCEFDINECTSNPCQNNSTCTDLIGRFYCTCLNGYYGNTCELKYNNCLSQPCRNNGSCVDLVSSFQCLCQEGFYGDICQYVNNTCESSPCIHGYCISGINTFNCACFSGFQGVLCDQDIDECSSSPCSNNATCINTIGSFYCSCKPGYQGLLCETRYDQCVPSPCLRGNCSEDSQGNFKCLCPNGFTGNICELDINECNLSVCFNNATCTNFPGSYACNCPTGYTGSSCELTIDYCSNVTCFNNGLCNNLIGSYECRCLPGFTGNLCQIDIDECQSKPCLNNATCITTLSNPNSYTCICSTGFESSNCETLSNPCSIQPCLNNATCKDLSTFTAPNSYICQCPIGFSGSNCQTKLNPCDIPNICLNNATCLNKSDKDYECVCKANYTGINCETKIDACFSNPCLNSGICKVGILSPPDSYVCLCNSNFTGINCEKNRTVCEENTCLNNGLCYEASLGIAACNCTSGTFGSNCQNIYDVCQSQPCVNGFCTLAGINNYTCQCYPGFTGPNCEFDINECESNPCFNNATCSTPFLNMYRCECPYGYEGTNCERSRDFCRLSPCYNNATCTQNLTSFSCLCLPGYTGSRCEAEIDECASFPCQNNAFCRDLINDYNCNCLNGTSGKNCQTVLNFCDSYPCKNNATCITYPFSNYYRCECPVGFTGTNCDISVDYCRFFSPCRNNASCLNIYDSTNNENTFLCLCQEGFTGKQCETIIDPCSSRPCQNNATCRFVGISKFLCVCPQNWAGLTCNTSVDFCKSDPCLNGGTCFNSGNSYTCACNLGYEGTRCEIIKDFCVSNPCKNNATCMSFNNSNVNTYKCICQAGYQGYNCEDDVNECLLQSTCFSNSFCINTYGSYECNCLAGFTGQFCSTKIQACSSSPCLNGAKCIEIINTTTPSYECQCQCGFFGPRCENEIQPCSSNPCLNGGTCQPSFSGCFFSCSCLYPYTGQLCLDELSDITTRQPSIGFQQQSLSFNGILKKDFFDIHVLECLFKTWNNVNPSYCSENFNKIDRSCYRVFNNSFIPGLTFNSAKQICLNLRNSSLVSINDNVEYHSLLKNLTGLKYDLWTSGEYISPNLWKWADNTLLSDQIKNYTDLSLFLNDTALYLEYPNYRLKESLKSTSGKGFVCENELILFPNSSLSFMLKSLQNALLFYNNSYVSQLTTFTFDSSFLSQTIQSYGSIKQPTIDEYQQFCPQLTNQDTIVNIKEYWKINICGRILVDSDDFNNLNEILVNVWKATLTQFNIVNVKIYDLVYFHNSNGEIITQMSYTVIIPQFKIIYEPIVNTGPSNDQLNIALSQRNYLQCSPRFMETQLFNLKICNLVAKSEYSALELDLKEAWAFIIGSNKTIDIKILSQEEYVNINESQQATLIHYYVVIDNSSVDSTSNQYDYKQIKERLALRRSICENSYPYNAQFRLITREKICLSRLKSIENHLSLSLSNSTGERLQVFIPYIAVDEYIEPLFSGNIYYSWPIYIFLNSSLIDSRNNSKYFELLRDQLQKLKFTLIHETQSLYRKHILFEILANSLIPSTKIINIESIVKQAIEINQQYSGSIVTLIRQDELNGLDSSPNLIYRSLFLVKDPNGVFYDARIDNQNTFKSYVTKAISLLNVSIDSNLLEVIDVDTSIYFDLSQFYTFYIKNSYLKVPSIDMSSFSRAANQQWNEFYNNSRLPASLHIINIQTYLDNSEMVLGIRYIIKQNQSLLERGCFDSSSFKMLTFLQTSCPSASYSSYQTSNLPTNRFFSLRLRGLITHRENEFFNSIVDLIHQSWIKQYSNINSSQIEKPLLAIPFEEQIGSNGKLLTGIYYTIKINGKLMINSIDNSPNLALIKSIIDEKKLDFEIGDDYKAVNKLWLPSVYVKKYPLVYSDIEQLEKRIYQLKSSNESKIMFTELYYDNDNKDFITRVSYLFVYQNDIKLPCEQPDLFVNNVANFSLSHLNDSFGSLVKARHVDILTNKFLTNTNLIGNLIESLWKNKHTDMNNLTATILGQSRYVTKYGEPVIRIKYSLTNNGIDINLYNSTEPLIDEINKHISNFSVKVYPHTPQKSYRIHLTGSNLNAKLIEETLNRAYNLNILTNLNTNSYILNDFNSNQKLSRFNYTISSIYDENEESFYKIPNNNQMVLIFNRSNLTLCTNSCLPSLFYDFYVYTKPTDNQLKEISSFGIPNAWKFHNFDSSILGPIKLQAKVELVEPSFITSNEISLTRIVYKFGLTRVLTSKRFSESIILSDDIDPDDLDSPSDLSYNQTIGNMTIVFIRNSDKIITSINYQADTVNDITWWMILVIVLAIALLIAIIAILIFSVYSYRNAKEGINSQERTTEVIDANRSDPDDEFINEARLQSRSISSMNRLRK